MGGTFDNLHAGHKRLLTAASNLSNERLTIGVTSDAYLAKKKKAFGDLIEPVEVCAQINDESILNDSIVAAFPGADAAGPGFPQRDQPGPQSYLRPH